MVKNGLSKVLIKNKINIIIFTLGGVFLIFLLIYNSNLFSVSKIVGDRIVKINNISQDDIEMSSTPTIYPKDKIIEDIFIKQEKGTVTANLFINPFSENFKDTDVSISNISQERIDSQKYVTLLETIEKNCKLFDTVYLKDKTNGKQKEIYSLQQIFYPYTDVSYSNLRDPIVKPEELKDIWNKPGSLRKVYALIVSPDDKYAIITTDEKIYVYEIASSSLIKAFDQQTPSDLYQKEYKYKKGYYYCFVSPFIFSPDSKRVLIHECQWEGTGVMYINLETKEVKDLEVPIGYGSKMFGWYDNNSIFFFDIYRDNKSHGLIVMNVNDFKEKVITSENGLVVSTSVIDGNIYFINEIEGVGLDLYQYDFSMNSLNKIAHSYNRFSFNAMQPELNIWKDGNKINWDIVVKEDVYRFQYNL